ncbi:MAG: hypothetical protein AAGJ93_01785, partial [Bacteroidota bacterium]
ERTMEKKHAKLILISIIAAICFNFPVLRILGGRQLIGGIPKLYFSLFLIWLAIIFFSYLVIRDRKTGTKNKGDTKE